MKKKDLIFIISVFIISIACLFITGSGKKGATAVITVNGSCYGRYDLGIDQSVHIVNDNGIVNDLEIAGGYIFMRDATCPNRECIACGKIRNEHESICCAPAGLIVTVESGEGSNYDAITK